MEVVLRADSFLQLFGMEWEDNAFSIERNSFGCRHVKRFLVGFWNLRTVALIKRLAHTAIITYQAFLDLLND